MASAADEAARQAKTGDSKFLGGFVYLFELRVPRQVAPKGGSTSLLFPLVLNPEQIRMSEPYALAVTVGAGGVLHTDEGGIVVRNLQISGFTGLKPRPYRGSAGFPALKVKTDLVRFPIQAQTDYSGQRHFQFLRTHVFRTYAELRRNAETSEGTRLFWHNLKDDEHWEVKPREFSSTRNSRDRGRLTYPYELDLLALGPAQAAKLENPTRSTLDKVKDGIRAVQSGIATARAAVQELTRVVNEVKLFVRGFLSILNQVVLLIEDSLNFVNGLVDFIRTPFEAVASLSTQIEGAFDVLSRLKDNADDTFNRLPDRVMQQLLNLDDALHTMMAHPEAFQTPAERRLAAMLSAGELTTALGAEEIRATLAQIPPNSFQQYERRGSGPLPSDPLRALGERGVSRNQQRRYRSARQHILSATDTLSSLAGRYLGDPGEWRLLALLNSLRDPYISPNGQPGTLGPGDAILIPSTDRPPQETGIDIYGVPPDAPAEERFCGGDYRIKRGPDGRYRVFADRTLLDAQIAVGIDNVLQAADFRVVATYGQDPLFQDFGRRGAIGSGMSALDQQLGMFRIQEALQQDPRLTSVTVTQEASSGDQIAGEATAQVVGLEEPVRVRLEAQ